MADPAGPHLSEILKNYFTALALLIGGGWALWKWGFEERLRRKKTRPSLDGELAVRCLYVSDETAFVTISSIWRNRIDYPFTVNNEETCIKIFDVTGSEQPRHVVEKDDCLLQVRPYAQYQAMHFGAHTENRLIEHFCLPRDRVFLASWHMLRRPDEEEPKKRYDTFVSCVFSTMPECIEQSTSSDCQTKSDASRPRKGDAKRSDGPARGRSARRPRRSNVS